MIGGTGAHLCGQKAQGAADLVELVMSRPLVSPGGKNAECDAPDRLGTRPARNEGQGNVSRLGDTVGHGRRRRITCPTVHPLAEHGSRSHQIAIPLKVAIRRHETRIAQRDLMTSVFFVSKTAVIKCMSARMNMFQRIASNSACQNFVAAHKNVPYDTWASISPEACVLNRSDARATERLGK